MGDNEALFDMVQGGDLEGVTKAVSANKALISAVDTVSHTIYLFGAMHLHVAIVRKIDVRLRQSLHACLSAGLKR
jgi:hypothetical protein